MQTGQQANALASPKRRFKPHENKCSSFLGFLPTNFGSSPTETQKNNKIHPPLFAPMACMVPFALPSTNSPFPMLPPKPPVSNKKLINNFAVVNQ